MPLPDRGWQVRGCAFAEHDRTNSARYAAHGFAAFERRDFSATIDALEPIAGELERIGGSRAQFDLVEIPLLKASAWIAWTMRAGC
jgi:hypothetical protein